ncbi:MBL fold metallo-hydrolase [Flavitalea sp. BT771]|uniref:MBL fold metallo-hydrolase n=1 Tax=Flavitalea sp. BT771 TaxID=3063329 RepID=UPI0026E216FB|nr:MBL fold metallo-hydrolase [Flavitalea sp. BT771]MDO6430273.1 MBL fold metallo-hydrolase [Flavitalea sp. BT771]MDV6219587.1 MBL fold metallo-hydrolase [Flavitalea sp. BT771]
MNRRTVLKRTGIAAVAAVSPFPALFSGASNLLTTNTGSFRFKVGDLQLWTVTDGHALFKPAQPIFAPDVRPDAINDLLKENFLAEGAVDIAFNVLVLQKDKELILFDTGCGINFGPESGKLPDNLRNAGIHPTDVTAILLTHGHPDHIGGLLDKDGNQVFPKAAVYIAAPEYNFWMKGEPDFSKSKFPDKNATAAWVKLARTNLAAYQDRLHLFNDGDVLFGCIKTRIVPGHTPGHTITEIHSGDEVLLHMGDTAHDHVILLAHPEWGVGFDTDFDQAARARRKVLTELAERRVGVFAFHLPWPGLGHVRRSGAGFEWVERAIATP